MGEKLLKCLVLLCTLLALMMANNVELSAAKVLQQLSWEVEYMKWAPDCKESIVMGINGMFPGPTIRAKAGDTIQVNVTNKLDTEGVVIHWHGIRQLGTLWADGTASISQCPINPGETFTYRFIVDKAGTHFYHGHYGMQRSAGLYGSLIIDVGDGEKEPFHYNSELSVLLSDWWHLGTREQGVRLSSNPVHWIGEPQTLLINGRGQFDCSLAASKSFLDRIKELFGAKKSLGKCKFTGTETCAPPILYVDPNKTYRLRIVSTTSLVPLNLQIENHKMTVVEADGNYVEPFDVTDLDIYSGESYSVLLKTDQNPSSNYWVSVGVRGRKPNTTQALTILNYHPLPALDNLPKTQPPITPLWNDYTHSKSFANKSHGLLNSSTYNSPPTIYHRRIILLNTQNTINGYTKWSINNVSLALPSTPYLGAIKFGLKDAFDQNRPAEDFSKDYNISSKPTNPNANYGNAPYVLRHWEIVDVVLQNANVLYHMDSEIHPWHLHGHDFWVLGYGEGRFEAEIHEKSFNLVNPPLKNTVVIFPYGWTAFRFVANNPGVWAFHCHIEAHLFMGMGVVFAEAIEKIGQVPGEAMACGLTATTAIKSTKLIKP